MLTRSRARASNQPVFIDDQWNDAYIQTKDEQIDAMRAAQTSSPWSWDELEDEDEDVDASDEDAWHSDSDDSEDNDADWLDRRPRAVSTLSFGQRWVAGGSLWPNVGWTLATVSVVPMLLYLSLPHREEQWWPLESPRLAGMLSKVVLNVLTLAVAAAMLYGATCSLEPLTLSAALDWRLLDVETPAECRERRLHEARAVLTALVKALAMESSSNTPSRRFDEAMETLIANVDARVVRESVALIAAVLVTVTCFHRVWAKTLVLLTAASCVVWNVMTEVKMQQRAAVEIFSLDPTFAFVNESILVALDGQNLEEGGSVAWAPYWGGMQQKRAKACPKLYPQQLSNGGVLVTFGNVNEYVPCYLNAQDTAAAVIVDGEIQPSEAFQCFESIRLRVKDPKSVPGWSLHQHQQEEDLYSMEKQEL